MHLYFAIGAISLTRRIASHADKKARIKQRIYLGEPQYVGQTKLWKTKTSPSINTRNCFNQRNKNKQFTSLKCTQLFFHNMRCHALQHSILQNDRTVRKKDFFSRRNIDWIQLNVRVRRRRFIVVFNRQSNFHGQQQKNYSCDSCSRMRHLYMFLYDFNIKIAFESAEFGVNVT